MPLKRAKSAHSDLTFGILDEDMVKDMEFKQVASGLGRARAGFAMHGFLRDQGTHALPIVYFRSLAQPVFCACSRPKRALLKRFSLIVRPGVDFADAGWRAGRGSG